MRETSSEGSTFALELPVGVVAEAEGAEVDGIGVRLVVPGGGPADDLKEMLRAAGADPDTAGASGALVYDLRRLDGDDRLDDRWLDKLAAHAPPETPCLLVGDVEGRVVSRLASRFHLAISVAPPVSEQAIRRALRLIVASASRDDGEARAGGVDDGAGATRRGRVLVVEDNPVNSMVTAKILETGGYTPVMAASGEAALDILESEDIDAVLMDVNMPGESGIETVKLFRFTEFGSDRRIPIVALTADATPETRQACLDAGMDDYVTKPVDARRLLDTLGGHLTGSTPKEPRSASDAVMSSPSKVLDLAAVGTLLELDPSGDFLIEVADEFVQDARALVAEIELAWMAGDTERVADLLHGLKSAAGYAGAAQVRARASALHAELPASEPAHSLADVVGFVRDADVYRTAIASHVTNRSTMHGMDQLPEGFQ